MEMLLYLNFLVLREMIIHGWATFQQESVKPSTVGIFNISLIPGIG